jgi:predicted CoA-binding protein
METKSIRTLIDEFLRQKRIAVVGVSRSEKEFSRKLFQDLRAMGYDCIPVNPSAATIDGITCYKHVTDISPPVEGVLLLAPRSVTDEVILECATSRVPRVWVFGIGREKGISQAALNVCREYKIDCIPGYCPYMFLPDASFFHKMHATIMKLFGRYPK